MGKQEQVKVQKPERGEARELKNKVHVKKGDTVYILNGKDRGKKGKVLRVLPSKQMVIVEGVNMVQNMLSREANSSRVALFTEKHRYTRLR